MTKRKAFVQLESGLDGPFVMIYKIWPSFHQVSTQNESFAHVLKLLPLLVSVVLT